MVSVTRTPSSKPKRRHSLFGLKKSATSSTSETPDLPAAMPQPADQTSSSSYAAATYPATFPVSTPAAAPTAGASRSTISKHARSYQQFPPQQQTSQQFAFPRRDAPSPQRRVTDEHTHRLQQDLDDTLPLQAFASGRGARDSFEDPSSAVPQLQGHSGVPLRPRSGSAPVHHDRHRSHFSIPDVMVTGCEEEGDEIHFEVKLPAEKRRTRLYTDRKSAHESDIRKSISGKIRPLLRLDNDSSPKLPSNWNVASPTTPTTPSSSSVASTEPNTPPKRTRKSSFPLLFGKNKDSRAAATTAAPEAEAIAAPPTTTSQRAPQPRSGSPYSQSGFDSSGSLPSSSSRDSLPSSTPSTPPADVPLASAVSKQDLSRAGPAVHPLSGSSSTVPLPAVMPPLRSMTKKERKLREKEELALMKELQRVDKMVREHDAKATKARRKEEKKQRSERSDSGASVPDGTAVSSSSNARGGLPKALKRMTIFSAAPVKPSPAAVTGSNLARRNSALRREGVPPRTRASRQMSDPLVLTRSSGQAQDAGPARPSTPPARFNIPTIVRTSPPRPEKPPPLYANAEEAEAARAASLDIGSVMSAKNSDESERPSFSPQEWADLPRFDGQPALTSLAGESAYANYTFEALAYEPSNAGEDSDNVGLASSSWRHSVQRALAMADEYVDDAGDAGAVAVAPVASLAKKTSVRRRYSSRKRGSDGFGSGTGSKRSSASHEGTVGSEGLVRKRSHLLGKKEALAEEPSDHEWEDHEAVGAGEGGGGGDALTTSHSTSSEGKTSWESSLDGQATPVVRTAQLGEETPTGGSRVPTPLPRREGSGSSEGFTPLPSPSREEAVPRATSPEAMERMTKSSFSSRKHSRTPKPLNLQQQQQQQQQSMMSSMSFNVGEIVPGSPPTVDFPPLPLEVLRGRKSASRSRTDSTGTGSASGSGSGSGSEDLGASSVSSSSVSSPTSMSSSYSIAGPSAGVPLEKVAAAAAAGRPIAAAFMSGSAL